MASTAGSISTTRTRFIPGTSARTRVVTPLPNPITRADAASGRAAAGASPSMIWVFMSGPSDASTFPFTRSVRPFSPIPHTHGRIPALTEGDLALTPMRDERAAGRGIHLLTRVDGGCQVDQARAPSRRADRDSECHARERARGNHPAPQPPVPHRPRRDASSRERGEREGGSAVDHQSDAQRRLAAEHHHEDETREHGASDAAQGVECVGATHIGTTRRIGGGSEIGEQWKREAHADRRDQDYPSDGHTQKEKAGNRSEFVHAEIQP